MENVISLVSITRLLASTERIRKTNHIRTTFEPLKALTNDINRVLSPTTDINEAKTQHQQLYIMAYIASLRPNADYAQS